MSNLSKIILLQRVEEEDADILAAISKRAFHSDIDVGAPSSEPGGPLGYDSPSFQKRFMRTLVCYKILLDESIVGGLYISSKGNQHRILERVFVDPPLHNRGIATQAIELLWGMYSSVKLWTLGTPEWNVRTRHFYEKLGFSQVGWEGGNTDWRGVWYQKVMDPIKPYEMMRIGDLQNGVKNVTVEPLKIGTPFSISKLNTVDALILGSPVVYGNVTPAIQGFLDSLNKHIKSQKLNLSGVVGGVFGSYAFSGSWVIRNLSARMKDLGFRMVGPTLSVVDGLGRSIPFSLDEITVTKCYELGRIIAQTVSTAE